MILLTQTRPKFIRLVAVATISAPGNISNRAAQIPETTLQAAMNTKNANPCRKLCGFSMEFARNWRKREGNCVPGGTKLRGGAGRRRNGNC
jgi:hypothetical protein